ncbi:peptide deformylase [Desulfosarcina sp. BuS5]|uniref:peptide deformylase n=1 Tax=Desulfosarcina sp. BuS5 TaxID=933262 RepID=UPI0004868E02|nr:peptide deformylase [Desulfosarcina sp. BuS5]WDN88534.1 peptide deformylase [Desulfosarcina sp. BuS5]
MEKLEILTYPDKSLRNLSKPVENIDGKIIGLIDSMTNIMYTSDGVGLAAIQVGIEKKIIIYDVEQNNGSRDLQVLINPKIISMEGEKVSENEGCLSLPDLRANVKRAASVFAKGLDREGNSLEIEAEGLLSVVLQHEIDHLNGVLFIDHLSALKRNLYKKRVKKKMKKG